MTAQPGDQVMIPRGFLCSSALALLLLITTAVGRRFLSNQHTRRVCDRRPASANLKAEGGRLGLVSGKPARHPGRKSQRRSADSAIARRGPKAPVVDR